MSIINAIILGLVQGITEFIPVSSSGHLAIASRLLGVDGAFAFDVLLNFGTLLALIIFYRRRLLFITKNIFINKRWGLLLKIIVATIPAVLFGILLKDNIEKLNEMIWVIIATLAVVGVLMIIYGRESFGADDREIESSVGWKGAMRIGISQTLALIPGVSRSGITILAGLRSNLSASKAAEFSFLLAIPVIAGASLKTLFSHDGLSFFQNNISVVLIGNIASFTAGILAVNFLIKLISKRGLKDFGWYRVGLASLLIILVIFRVI
ncbi:MAG: undecaprenyl-diphosphatase [Patescibacteria group bacterium]|nr:undecaprenyl-diphosphatase [Patescibacteria group bacterium]